MEIFEKKEWGLISAIIIIVVIILVFAYLFIFNSVEKNKDVDLNNKDGIEIINNQNNTLKETDIDIKEIEKRLDELDVNIDDIFEQL